MCVDSLVVVYIMLQAHLDFIAVVYCAVFIIIINSNTNHTNSLGLEKLV